MRQRARKKRIFSPFPTPSGFLNFLRALYDLERETGESVNRLSNASYGTVFTLYMSSCTGSAISYSQTVSAGVGELILQMMIQAEGEGRGKDN